MPAWLLADPGMQLRCFHQPFIDKIDAYYDVLLPKLVPLLCTNDGPIITIQIENEYGSYGNDNQYLEYLRESKIKRDIDVLLFTSDGPGDFRLQGCMVPGVLETVNFGSQPVEAFTELRIYQPDGPIMCMEFWKHELKFVAAAEADPERRAKFAEAHGLPTKRWAYSGK